MRASAAPRLLLDRLGLAASTVCLVHCLALPFVLTGLSAWGLGAAHEAFHVGVALVTVPLALLAARPGYREHRNATVPALLGAGALAFLAGVAFHDGLSEAVVLGLSVLGSGLLLAGHLLNFRLRRRCEAHAFPHHEAHHH